MMEKNRGTGRDRERYTVHVCRDKTRDRDGQELRMGVWIIRIEQRLLWCRKPVNFTEVKIPLCSCQEES